MAIITSMATRVIGRLSGVAAVALLALASTSLTRAAFSLDFAPVLKHTQLNGTNGFRINGDGTFNFCATDVAVARLGRYDKGKLMIGCPASKPNGVFEAGRIYVVTVNEPFPAVMELNGITSPDGFNIFCDGEEEWCGAKVGAGDTDGNGLIEHCSSAPGKSFSTFPGKAQCAFVPEDFAGDSFDITDPDTTTIKGVDAGDVGLDFDLYTLDLDEFIEVGVCFPGGEVGGDAEAGLCTVLEPAAPGIYADLGHFSPLAPSGVRTHITGFQVGGTDAGDHLGTSIAGAGDVNGDGFGDFVIGAPGGDPGGDPDAGESYVVFGRASIYVTPPVLASLDGTKGFRADGIDPADASGTSVASAGDVNGDGFGDFVIGAPGGDPNGFGQAGESYVVFGKGTGFASVLDLASLNGTTGFRIDGINVGDASGGAVAAAGDVNGDGFGDVLIGAAFADHDGFYQSGETYVVFGKASGFASSISLSGLDGNNGFRFDGEAQSGSAVASGDVNGDGFDDIVIGAPNAGVYPASHLAGAAFVVFGRAPKVAVSRTGSAAGQYISGGKFNDTLSGVGGDDELEGRGGGDVLKGGPGFRDAASYAHAPGAVVADMAAPAGNTGHASGDSYAGIEDLAGSRFNDTLRGNDASNRLTGGPGRDTKTGRGGNDIFRILKVSDSPPGPRRDLFTDFDPGTATTAVDRIDLSAIDAKTGPGNDAFTFIGTAPFTNVKGQLRAKLVNATTTIIQGDVTGDGKADIEIGLFNFTATGNLKGNDFIK